MEEHPYYGYPTVTKGPIDISKVTMFKFKYIYSLEGLNSGLDHTKYIPNDNERSGPRNIELEQKIDVIVHFLFNKNSSKPFSRNINFDYLRCCDFWMVV